MKFEANGGQISVETATAHAFVNVDSQLAGYAARLSFPNNYQRCYVCTRGDATMTYLFVVVDDEWRRDIEQLGYTIIGEISDLSRHKEADHG